MFTCLLQTRAKSEHVDRPLCDLWVLSLVTRPPLHAAAWRSSLRDPGNGFHNFALAAVRLLKFQRSPVQFKLLALPCLQRRRSAPGCKATPSGIGDRWMRCHSGHTSTDKKKRRSKFFSCPCRKLSGALFARDITARLL